MNVVKYNEKLRFKEHGAGMRSVSAQAAVQGCRLRPPSHAVNLGLFVKGRLWTFTSIQKYYFRKCPSKLQIMF